MPDRMRGTLAISSNNCIKRLGWFRGLRWKDIFIWRYEPTKRTNVLEEDNNDI